MWPGCNICMAPLSLGVAAHPGLSAKYLVLKDPIKCYVGLCRYLDAPPSNSNPEFYKLNLCASYSKKTCLVSTMAGNTVKPDEKVLDCQVQHSVRT